MRRYGQLSEDKEIVFWWNLFRLHPRVDMEIPKGVDTHIFKKYFPFTLRTIDCTDVHRHYKLPVMFHIPFVRWHYMKKLNKVINTSDVAKTQETTNTTNAH